MKSIDVVRIDFLTTLDVRFQDGIKWQLTAPFVAIALHKEGAPTLIRVPDGFVTDFASVPRLPLVYLKFANRAHQAAVLHDYLYSVGGVEEDRQYADTVFLQGMLDTKMDEEDAAWMYNGVRSFGAPHFNYNHSPR